MTLTPFPLLPAATSGFGLLLLGLASALYLRKKSKYSGWAKTKGRLDAFKEERGRNGQVFAPIVTFHDSSSQAVTFTSRLSSSNKRFAIGDEVPVLYSPLDSSQAMIDRNLDLYFIEIILGAAGAWGLIAGPLVAFLSRGR